MTHSLASRNILITLLAIIGVAAMLSVSLIQETPVGTIRGKVLAAETGKPIPKATIWLVSTDKKGDRINLYQQSNTHGDFKFENVPEGHCTIAASAQVHNIPESEIYVREGREQIHNLKLEPGAPDMNLLINQNAFTDKETPEIILHGFTKSREALLTIYKLNLSQLTSEKNRLIIDFLNGNVQRGLDISKISPAIGETKLQNVDVSRRDCEGVYHINYKLNGLTPGIYILSAKVDGITRWGWISKSNISLVTKGCGDNLLIYAVRPDSGDPVPGVKLQIIQRLHETIEGTTNSSGLWSIQFPKTTGAEPDRFVIAHLGDSVAIVNLNLYQPVAANVTTYGYTDRPLYRPGQTVYFKGISRVLTDAQYKLPAKGEARVEISDPRNTLIYSKYLKLSDFGSFNGSLKLPGYTLSGQYNISCTVQGHQDIIFFNVASYKKPEFSVTVEPLQKRCRRGDTVKVKIQASYYFGAPVANAHIRYSISRSDYWFNPSENMLSDVGYEDYGGYGEDLQSGVTKTDSKGAAVIQLHADWPIPPDSFIVMDQQFTLYASVTDDSGRVSDGEGSVIATQGDYHISYDAERTVIGTGEDASFYIDVKNYDGKPQNGVQLNVTACRMTWSQNAQNANPVKTDQLTTNSTGHAQFRFRPLKPGSYELHISCKDRSGNEIRSSEWFWVFGKGDTGNYKYPDLKLSLDKRIYNPGEKARLLINSKERGGQALLTIEGSRLYSYKVVELKENSTLIEIPIEPNYKPNFYISVCLVKNKKLINQQVSAQVSLKAESIRVSLSADKKNYEPGEKIHYRIKTTDLNGKPVSAEVSLGVVDEALYALMEDMTTNIRDFFYGQKPDSVDTRYSFPEVYMSGDKAGFSGKIRKQFVDTAYWNANLVTDKNGEAVAFFKMPDNLTTWRATARACTLNTSVGECKSTVITSKKFLVRLETPKFLIQGDECLITASVHNYLPKSEKARVSLQTQGLSLLNQSAQVIDIESGGVKILQWKVRAAQIGKATLTVYASAPDAQDAMKLAFPIHPQGLRQTSVISGFMSPGTLTKTLSIPSGSIAGTGEIRIRLAPSIGSAMLGSLDYLTEYPYGCMEQTMSAFIPDVVVWKTLKSLRIQNLDLTQRLPDMVGKGLGRIYESQRDDGSWGWCQYGPTDPWMTTYAVYGLLMAKSAGFTVNDNVLSSGKQAVHNQLKRKIHSKEELDARLFTLYVLSMNGESKFAWKEMQSLPKHPLDSKGLAYTAMISQNAGQKQTALKNIKLLWKKAIIAGDHVYWDAQDLWDDSSSERTAIALHAIMKITPEDPRIPLIIHHLLSERRFNHWYSTRDTAMVLYALADYIEKTKELDADYRVKVVHNGKILPMERFTRKDIFSPEREITLRTNESKNTVKFQMSGKGRLYYTLQMQQYQNAGSFRNTHNSGLFVTKEYKKITEGWDWSAWKKRLWPTDSSYSNFRMGDVIRVKIIVTNRSKNVYHRLLVEDYLPAGCEAFDRGKMQPWEWNYWYSDRDVRDERISYYIDRLPRGQSVLEYEMRAGTPGNFIALPPVLQGMYQPDLQLCGKEMRVRIK